MRWAPVVWAGETILPARISEDASIDEIAVLLEAYTRPLGPRTWVAVDGVDGGSARNASLLGGEHLIELMRDAATRRAGSRDVPGMLFLDEAMTRAVALHESEYAYEVVVARRDPDQLQWSDYEDPRSPAIG